MSNTNSGQQPSKMPPSNVQANTIAGRQSSPAENSAMSSMATGGTMAPSKIPPGAAKSGIGAIATVWNNSATINALWSINQDKNSWIGVAGIGWKKLSNASDSGIVSLTMLSSLAKQSGSTVYYREEDDGMVHEMYVW